MGRFIVYAGENPILLADLITRPQFSIIKQSVSQTEGFVNGDGFGLGWYDTESDDPCVFTSITPAWSNKNLSRIADKIKSPLVFAHVRSASPEYPVSEAECHPFQYGRYLFMHDGELPAFLKFKRSLRETLSDELYEWTSGNTDSEHCFALFLNQLPVLSSSSLHHTILVECMLETLRLLIRWCSEHGSPDDDVSLNFAVSDGQSVIATRCTTNTVQGKESEARNLYFACGSSFEATDESDTTYIVKSSERREELIIVASEPLTKHQCDWVKVPTNHVVVATPGRRVLLMPIQMNAPQQPQKRRQSKMFAVNLNTDFPASPHHSQRHNKKNLVD